jgi:hypothetical protein
LASLFQLLPVKGPAPSSLAPAFDEQQQETPLEVVLHRQLDLPPWI